VHHQRGAEGSWSLEYDWSNLDLEKSDIDHLEAEPLQHPFGEPDLEAIGLCCDPVPEFLV
jgi:hypothetical protein